jgi:hypothetical protein
MDSLLEEFKCSCGNPEATGVIHKTQGPCMHPSGLSVDRWNWPYKTPEERAIVAKWFAKHPKYERSEF